MKKFIVFALCFSLIFMNISVVCLADPNLNDTDNYKEGVKIHQQGKYQDAYDLYFKDLSPTTKNTEWLQNYKKKFLDSGPQLNIVPASGDQCKMGLEAAKIDAQSVGGGNMVGGVVAGGLLGLIGTVIVWAIAGSSEPDYTKLVGRSDVYANCYKDTYFSTTKSRKKSKALVGGLIGTAIMVVIYVAATSN